MLYMQQQITTYSTAFTGTSLKKKKSKMREFQKMLPFSSCWIASLDLYPSYLHRPVTHQKKKCTKEGI
ncbi:hypothetical protein Hanom_Chr02g00177901 [Helianthus anomalus]